MVPPDKVSNARRIGAERVSSPTTTPLTIAVAGGRTAASRACATRRPPMQAASTAVWSSTTVIARVMTADVRKAPVI